MIVTVKRGSAAHLAGIQSEDKILTFNDHSVGSPATTTKKTAKKIVIVPSTNEQDIAKAKAAAVAALKKVIQESHGKEVSVVIRRAGKNIKLTVKVPDDGDLGISEVQGDKW